MEVTVRTIGVGSTILGPTSVVQDWVLFRADVVLQCTRPSATIYVSSTGNGGIVRTLTIHTTIIKCVAVRILTTETYTTHAEAKISCTEFQVALIGVEITSMRGTFSALGSACTTKTQLATYLKELTGLSGWTVAIACAFGKSSTRQTYRKVLT